MKKPVYIREKKGLRLFRDGYSIVIRRESCSDMRIALAEIERLVLYGGVRIDASIVPMLAGAGIPLVFLNMAGRESAVTTSLTTSSRGMTERMEALAMDDEAVERYRDILSGRRSQFMLSIARSISGGLPMKYKKQGVYCKQFSALLESATGISVSGQAFGTARKLINGFYASIAMSAAREREYDPEAGIIDREAPMGFVKELCFALDGYAAYDTARYLDLHRIRCGITAPITKLSEPELVYGLAVKMIEDHTKTIKNKLDIVLGDIFALAREVAHGKVPDMLRHFRTETTY